MDNTMEEAAARSIATINQNIEKLNDKRYSKEFLALQNDLHTLFNLTSSKNNLARLFCRRLARVLDYNKSFTHIGWPVLQQVHEEILYILKENDVSIENLNYMKFSSILKLEGELQQRELQFKTIGGDLKNWHELIELHRDFVDEYLGKCISLHSTLQVQDLIENVNDLLRRTYRQKDIILDSQTKEHLQTRLRCLEIPLECSYRYRLYVCAPRSVSPLRSHDERNDSENVFLPGLEDINILGDHGIIDIYRRLEESRWIVILGNPGSAKTTIIRLIMRHFSVAALHGEERVMIKGVDCGPVRIPILIRVNEFTQWLDDHPTMTLIDYIGKHTWFSQFYSNDDNGCVLKEFIHHGHALILVDGLDDIPVSERRCAIVKLIQEFIHEHVRGRDFLSAFDDVHQDFASLFEETQPPSISGGNQIIVTSRVVGYSSNALRSRLIRHYFVSPMENSDARQFLQQWFQCIDQKVRSILTSEGVQLNIEKVNSSNASREKTAKNLLFDSRIELSFHPLILSMICSSLFKVSKDLPSPRSTVELYHITVQWAMRKWVSQQASMPEKVLIQFETDLALYLHLYSSSGLIDEFDMKSLCSLVLKQHHLSNDRAELRQYTNELINLVGCNDSIVVERGLKVFSFVHLSFQEYLVGRSLLRSSSIDDLVKRFLAYIMRSRFRKPLRLGLSWITWTWSPHDSDIFCEKLITESANYMIPLGALLYLDSIDHIRFESLNTIAPMALNSLLDHNSSFISIVYLGKHWPRLPQDMTFQWMESSLISENRVLKFCKSFLYSISLIAHRQLWEKSRDVLSVICQRLWSLHSISLPMESVITQTLRHIVTSLTPPQLVFKKELPEYLVSHGIRGSAIHPLVLSIIIALYGGIYKTEDQVYFSPQYMYRNPSVCIPITEYFENNNESHSIKVQKLIGQYEEMLREFSFDNISNDLIDIFIALICLRGLSQPSIYNEFNAYRALPLALNRFKRILFFLRDESRFRWKTTKQSVFSKIELILNVFVSQSTRSNAQCNWFSLSCVAACDQLMIEWLSYLSNFEVFFNTTISRPPESCRLIKYFYNTILSRQSTHVRGEPIPQAIKDVHLFRMLTDQSLLLLNFVPDSLERLYHRLVIAPESQYDSLPLIVLLSQCLIFFDEYTESEEMFVTLCDLLPLFKKHNLENYVLALFWESKSRYKCNRLRPDNDFFAQFSTSFTRSCEELIAEERQRILEAKHSNQVRQKDIQLFVASLSLARLLQVQYRINTNKVEINHININFLAEESEQVLSSIENINNPVLRIIAMSAILDMEYPRVFCENESDVLRFKMVDLIQNSLPILPFLTSTLLFVRCQSIRQAFPSIFEQFANMIGEQLVSFPLDEKTVQNQETVYITLHKMNDSLLYPFLTEFEKRTKNIGDLLQMNSVAFHHYFTDTTSFAESDHILLSLMYLAELAVDAQILKKNTNLNEQNAISSAEKLTQLLVKSKNVLTFEIATLITCFLKTGNQEDVIMINRKVFHCHSVQKNSQPVILQWFEYQMNESIRSLVYYAVLLLAKEGLIASTTFDKLHEVHLTSIDDKFNDIVRNFLELPSIDPVLQRDILIILIRDAHRSSLRTGAIIRSCEIMELILQLEYDRLSSSANSESFDSFLMIIDGCSLEVLVNVTMTSIDSEVQNSIKEQYLAQIVTWIIQHAIFERCTISDTVYNHIISFLHNGQFPHTQEAVLIGLKDVLMKMSKNNIFAREDVKSVLESAINLYVQTIDTYSEALLAACLNAYGYCLVFFKKYYQNQSASNEMYSLLKILFETSPSSIISERAGQCLLITELHVQRGSLSNWLTKKNLTPERIYNVFTRSTFDERAWLGDFKGDQAFIEVLVANPIELLPKFITELYTNLRKTSNNCDLSKQISNYICKTVMLCKHNLALFRTAMRQCSFDEEKFKSVLYQASKQGNNGDLYRIQCAQLYASFGELTPDLVDMVLNIKYDRLTGAHLVEMKDLINFKQILLDRYTIEKLYTALSSSSQRKNAIELLIHLAQLDCVSVLEMYQHISDNLNKWSPEDLCSFQYDYELFFVTVLKLSCIPPEGEQLFFLRDLRYVKKNNSAIFTEKEIYENFERRNR